MTHEIRVSRQGLTTCPSCLAHIRLDDDWARTTCPFCSASLLTATRAGRRDLMDVLRSVHSTAGGALAASLLSLGLSACGTQDLDGLTPADTGVQVVDAGDDPVAPLYGLPAIDAGFIDAGNPVIDSGVPDAALVDAGDNIPAPEYGQPPLDAGTVDATIVDAGDDIIQPHYGQPPPSDGGIIRIDAGTEDAGMTVALYGGAAIDAGAG